MLLSLPLVFGMNVGGVPWVPQVTKDPHTLKGFVNVMWICLSIILLMLLAFGAAPMYQWLRKQTWWNKTTYLPYYEVEAHVR